MNKPKQPTNRKAAKKTTASKPTKAAVGVRLDAEDLTFLGACAPGHSHSESLRMLISRARAQSVKPETADEAQGRILDILGGASELRTESGLRSVVIEDIVREALLVVATAQVGPSDPGLEDPKARLAYEALIVDRAFDFVETVLRHTLSETAPAWDPDVMRERLASARQTLVASLSATSGVHLPRSGGSNK